MFICQQLGEHKHYFVFFYITELVHSFFFRKPLMHCVFVFGVYVKREENFCNEPSFLLIMAVNERDSQFRISKFISCRILFT